MSCGQMKVNEMLRDILFKSCFIDLLLWLKCFQFSVKKKKKIL